MPKMTDTFENVRVTKVAKTKKNEKSAERVTHTFILDLNGVTVQQVVDSMVRTEVIKLQGRVRAHWEKHGSLPADLPAGEVVIKMADLLAGRSATQPTVGTTLAAASALTPEGREELMKLLEAQMAAEKAATEAAESEQE